MASVSWQYSEDQLIALRRQNIAAETAAPVDAGIEVAKLRFRYRIEGDSPPWRPLSAFDDGSKVYIEMPRGIGQGEAPPLFVIGAEGDGQLVNYRVRQNYYIVDRLFAAAELRLGGEGQQVVRIVRTDGRTR
jgi:type IV secretion system protein VirB9